MAEQKRPNLLYIMADQMAAPMLPMYNKESVIKTPNLDKLAGEGVVFESAYCNSPLCAPSRFSLVTGQLPSRIGGYDNAADLPADIPTYAHYLRQEGYHTALSGKMHFCGPDQLHGFEERLTSDIYPGDYGWSVNWDDPEIRPDWYHDMSSVLEAGPIVRTNQLDYDEEVIYKSTQWLYQHVRYRTDQPFALTVSMTHPHDPYAMTKDYWDLYEDVDIPMPNVSAIPHDKQDPHSRRVLKCVDLLGKEMPEASIRNARRAYFAACTFVDAQIGKLLKVLENTGLADNTIIVFSGDHGDMLGERGLWYKMVWYEMASRVPLIVHAPQRYKAGRVKESVSTMDLMPTFVNMVGAEVLPQLPIDGISLMPYIDGREGPKTDTVIGEYMGEGTICPVIMIRRGKWKFVYAPTDPPQLFDVEADPMEKNNLAVGFSNALPARGSSSPPQNATTVLKAVAQQVAAAQVAPQSIDAPSIDAQQFSAPQLDAQQFSDNIDIPDDAFERTKSPLTPPITPSIPVDNTNVFEAKGTPVASVVKAFLAEVAQRWDLEVVRQDVLTSQRRRRLVYGALMKGQQFPWEYVTPVDPTNQYHRNMGKGALGDVETLARWPRGPAVMGIGGK